MIEETFRQYCRFFEPVPGKELYNVRAPGRVNFLGAHTDYSGGMVLPAAIDLCVTITGQARDDTKAVAFSVYFQEKTAFSTENFSKDAGHSWFNYVRGIVSEFTKIVETVPGFQIVIDSNLPIDSGLSSSAAVEVGLAMIMQKICGTALDPLEIAQLCMNAENNYVGMNCGIMDQMTSVFGRSGHVLLINCGTRDFSYVPWDSRTAEVIIVDTQVKRKLIGTQFNTRSDRVLEGLQYFHHIYPDIMFSSQIIPDVFEKHAHELPDTIRPAIKHVVYENQRVAYGAEALQQGNYKLFGGFMSESFDSSRYLFGVTIPELDFIADFVKNSVNAYGAKLMGGGFGGSVAVLTAPENKHAFTADLNAAYERTFDHTPEIFSCSPASGAAISTAKF